MQTGINRNFQTITRGDKTHQVFNDGHLSLEKEGDDEIRWHQALKEIADR